MTGFIAVDMLSEISKALEYENDWTQLKDGVLECRLRDQYDGEHTGLARVTINKAARCPLWHGRTIRTNTRPCPSRIGRMNTIQPTLDLLVMSDGTWRPDGFDSDVKGTAGDVRDYLSQWVEEQS